MQHLPGGPHQFFIRLVHQGIDLSLMAFFKKIETVETILLKNAIGVPRTRHKATNSNLLGNIEGRRPYKKESRCCNPATLSVSIFLQITIDIRYTASPPTSLMVRLLVGLDRRVWQLNFQRLSHTYGRSLIALRNEEIRFCKTPPCRSTLHRLNRYSISLSQSFESLAR